MLTTRLRRWRANRFDASLPKKVSRRFAGWNVRRCLDCSRRSHRLIVAAGGGAILNEQTRCDMQAAGPVVWLTASIDTIVARMHSDTTTAERRPNLTADGGRSEVETVLTEANNRSTRRQPDVVIDTENRTVAQIVAEITKALAPRLQEGATE